MKAAAIWTVRMGKAEICSASQGLTWEQAMNKVTNERRQGILMEAAPADPAVVSTGDGRLLCTACGARTRDGRARFLRRHPVLCVERRQFARQLAQDCRSVED